MTDNVIPYRPSGVIIGGDDPWEITLRPAKAVLDALVGMWKPLMWLNQRRRDRRPLFEPHRACELVELLPTGARMANAGAMFLAAAENPAPESWTHIILGLMLQAENAPIDGDVYRGAVCDAAFRDPEVWQGYEPGFSAPVVVRALREARLQGALPSPGGFVNLCLKHRRQFAVWNRDLADLMQARYDAEDELGLDVHRNEEWEGEHDAKAICDDTAVPVR